MGCISCCGIFAIGIIAAVFALHKLYKERKKRAMLERWSNTPKDELILHGVFTGKNIPSVAIFCLKLATYLRLANIKYTVDSKDGMGPKGKTPWISINGHHVADTELIIEFLNKKFEKDLNRNSDPSTIAHATLIRVMFEEFFIWAISLERFIYNSSEKFGRAVGQSGMMFNLYVKFMSRTIRKKANAQGIGLHSKEEATLLMTKYLKSASVALGNKKFFGGDEPCQEDCGIFGILAQCLWALPDSPYEKLLHGECKNLKDYLIRIKEKAWPDWDEHLGR